MCLHIHFHYPSEWLEGHNSAEISAFLPLCNQKCWTPGSTCRLGPFFARHRRLKLRLAQWAATRRDIFPPHICDRLGTLHDATCLHPWRHTHQILTDTFGDYKGRGLSIDPLEVVGSGSAAQVYAGTLTLPTPDGRENVDYFPQRHIHVAVKVLHPNIRSAVDRDLLLMERVASLLNSLPFDYVKVLSLPRAADNFGEIIRKQLDLRVEGDNLDKFRSNFSGETSKIRKKTADIPKISFPRPLEGWVGSDVLVEEFVENATPISNYLQDSTEDGIILRKELAVLLLQAFLKMVFIDNFIHCDLHPGNVMVQTTKVPAAAKSWISKNSNDQNSSQKHTVVILDAGIATSLSPNDKKNLRDLFRAVILNDGERAGRLMVERARHESCSQIEGGVDLFAKGVHNIVAEFHDRRQRGLTLGAVRIGSLLSCVLDLCRSHGVEIDPAMASIVVSTLVLEGLGRSLEPDLNLIDCAMPFVMGIGKV